MWLFSTMVAPQISATKAEIRSRYGQKICCKKQWNEEVEVMGE
jgi:hypothetical protein